MQRIPKNYKRVDFPADNDQNKATYLKLNKRNVACVIKSASEVLARFSLNICDC